MEEINPISSDLNGLHALLISYLNGVNSGTRFFGIHSQFENVIKK
jgi:hypothetical protein